MEVTRKVILDLLPLYLADEVSEDTRALVENYLESDPELADIANRSAAVELQGNIPVPLTEEDEMRTYRRTRWMIFLFALIVVGMMALALFGVLAMFFISP
jgi:hypothetical protein